MPDHLFCPAQPPPPRAGSRRLHHSLFKPRSSNGRNRSTYSIPAFLALLMLENTIVIFVISSGWSSLLHLENYIRVGFDGPVQCFIVVITGNPLVVRSQRVSIG
ncbi:hypothetical protein BJY04DRAFT_161122 [Aspergillus karnatakaensis]|uniref:uncharacterized protein n=1 Tax=Aspergillus karnatakaensis TaxID=1810916 RepID=UPI003CCCCF60